MTKSKSTKHSARRDQNRRRRWQDKVTRSPISKGAKVFCFYLASLSDNTGKGVWGQQKKQAEALGVSERSIRYYRKEAEEAGLIKTCRTPYDPVLGCRPKTNYYILCIPPAKRRTAKKCLPPFIPTGNGLPVEQQPTVVCKTLGINKEEISLYRMPEMELDYPERPESEFAISSIAELRRSLASL